MKLAPPVALALLALCAPSMAQTTFFEQEPNDTKEQATPALDMVSGDKLQAGYDNCPPPSGDPEIFRVRTASLPRGIYRHTLQPAPGPFPEKSFPRILGRDFWNGRVLPDSYFVLQQAHDATVPARALSWYGFGKAEELYVDLDHTNDCRTTFEMVLDTVPVAPIDAGVVTSANFGFSTFDTAGQQIDTELQLYDADFEALPSLGVDDNTFDPAGHASIWTPLGPGRYYMAVTLGELATQRPPGQLSTFVSGEVFDEAAVFGGLTDFKDAAVAGGADLGATITVLIGNGQFLVTQVEDFEVFWFRFDVGAGQEINTFCTVESIGLGCPLDPNFPVGSGAGCTNSTGRGADLLARRQNLSAMPVWSFTIQDLPPSTLARLSFTFSAAPPVQLRAGYSCLGIGQVSLGPLVADGAGYVRTQNVDVAALGFAVGTTVYAQALYLDPEAPVGLQFNVSSGVSLVIP